MSTRADIAMGNAVQAEIFRRRLTQTELAKKLGWHQTTLSKKLHGTNAWSLEDILAIAEALEMDAVDLLKEMWGNIPAPQRRSATNLSLLCGRLEVDTLAG